MGRLPKPTAIKILEGNPGRRPLNKQEPKPREFRSRAPAHLDAEALQEWTRLVPILKRMKVMTEADYMGLANLCVAHSTLVHALAEQAKLREHGGSTLLVKTLHGYAVSPLLGIINEQTKLITMLLREFGMTPSSRTRVKTTESATQPHDPWQQF